jgi:hypothetical protein
MKLGGAEKFESLNYLEKCIECLEKSLTLTTSEKALESIKLQRNYHIKQRDLIQYHFEKFKKTEKQKLDTAIPVQLNERLVDSNKIQLDLFENIDGTDALLEELKKNPEPQTIAELQQMNSQLNSLVFSMITQLDDTVHENDVLKEKLKALEAKTNSRDDYRHQDELHLSTDAFEAQEEFAPLELPVFDLDSLDTKKN